MSLGLAFGGTDLTHSTHHTFSLIQYWIYSTSKSNAEGERKWAKHTRENRQKCWVTFIHQENRTLPFSKFLVMNPVDFLPKSHLPFLLPVRVPALGFVVIWLGIPCFLCSHVLQEEAGAPVYVPRSNTGWFPLIMLLLFLTVFRFHVCTGHNSGQ